MATTFVEITQPSEFDRLTAASHETPVLLFKHDTTCRISAAAHHQLKRVEGEIPLVDVARSKDLSLDIARRTGVTHESPQVILFRDGAAVWSASLYDITAEAVSEAMSAGA